MRMLGAAHRGSVNKTIIVFCRDAVPLTGMVKGALAGDESFPGTLMHC